MSASTARKLGVKNWNVSNGALNGSLVNITVNKTTYKNVPVMIQPVGRTTQFPWQLDMVEQKLENAEMALVLMRLNLEMVLLKINLVEGEYEFAATQLHHTMMGRDMIVKETSLSEYIKDPSSGNKPLFYQHMKVNNLQIRYHYGTTMIIKQSHFLEPVY